MGQDFYRFACPRSLVNFWLLDILSKLDKTSIVLHVQEVLSIFVYLVNFQNWTILLGRLVIHNINLLSGSLDPFYKTILYKLGQLFCMSNNYIYLYYMSKKS